MKINTDYMGEVEYSEDELISFPEGIFGFEENRNYIIIGELSKDFPFVWLQSADDASVVFVLTDPFLFVEDYDFQLSEENLELLKTREPEKINIYSMVVIPTNSKKTTINLKAPIVVNHEDRIAIQAILDEDYPYKHTIFK